MKKILIHPSFRKDLSEEFSVSKQTIDMSLKYVFNSEKAKKIRQRAKELLQKEIDNITE